MQIEFVFPALPPTLDGIGDHTALLAQELASRGHAVGIITAQKTWNDIPSVSVTNGFSLNRRHHVFQLAETVAQMQPEWLVFQFEQFSYGRWGLNPYVYFALRKIRKNSPATRIAIMFHEDYTPPRTLRNALMTMWQLPQFWLNCKMADLALFAVEPWVRRYKGWFPGLTVEQLTVGSNIPLTPCDKQDIRRELNIEPGDFVIGLFGGTHHSRLLGHVRNALDRLLREDQPATLLYVGAHGAKVIEAIGRDHRLIDAGRLSADDVSRYFRAMDLYLAPFRYGVSSRRGSFLVGIQHGIPTVSTFGPDTGDSLLEHNHEAFCLTDWNSPEAFADGVAKLRTNARRMEDIGQAGQSYYANYHAWPKIGERLENMMLEYDYRKSNRMATQVSM